MSACEENGMIPELAIRARMCSNCLSYDEIDAFCPMCGECSRCCECSALAIRGSISRPAYVGQFTDEYRKTQRRLRAFGLALMAAAISAFIFLWKIGVIR
ncbi:MAG: hypothetical protein ACRD8A_08790 [Candidatus Acidiferrales bacterium]